MNSMLTEQPINRCNFHTKYDPLDFYMLVVNADKKSPDKMPGLLKTLKIINN